MKLTVLVDNNTLFGNNYLGEPGLSLYIEDENNKILFDLGYSDALIRNAYKMGININSINQIVLSHGHLDHTWGLTYLLENLKPNSYQDPGKKISILTHPTTLCPKVLDGEPIGFIYGEAVLRRSFQIHLSEAPVWISEKLCYLGQIERTNDFENKKPLGKTINNGVEQDDYMMEDSALVYKTAQGLVIITGCSHSGICNIIEYAKKVCGEDRIVDVIGGFHLLNPSAEHIENTVNYMKKLRPGAVHACHCTDLFSKIELSKVVSVKEVGVGLTLEFE